MNTFETVTPLGKMRRYHQMAHFALQSYPLTVNAIRCLTIRHNIIFRVDAKEGIFVLRIGYPNIRSALMVALTFVVNYRPHKAQTVIDDTYQKLQNILEHL